MKFGEVDISKIEFDPRSRDEIPKLLMGLQEIYCNRKVRNKVFAVLRDLIPEGIDQNNGRKGDGPLENSGFRHPTAMLQLGL